MTQVATEPTLLERLSAAARRGLSGQEVREQRISFIMSAVDDDSTITKAQVEQVIRQFEGA